MPSPSETSVDINYVASPTLARFHQSDDFVRCLRGPFGSGKSVGSVMEILMRAASVPHSQDGYRRSRWAIVRNSYRELKDTTLRTWVDWIPPSIWKWRETDMTGIIEAGDIRCECLFRSLDTPADVGKLLSLELTGAWINEAKELPWAVIPPLTGRLGRYPKQTRGGQRAWSGLIMDTNSPDTDHWIYKQFEEVKPEGWQMFAQPSGLSPQAENLENLPADYYGRMVQSNVGNDDWIKVFVHGQYGFVQDGKPVYPEYTDSQHCVPAIEVPPILRAPIVIGMDFGLTPAAVFCQRDPRDGQWQIIGEVVSDDMGAMRFGEHVRRELQTKYTNRRVSGWGDPAGEQRAQTDERTVFNILEAQGLPMIPAPTNDFTLRREAVANLMMRMTMLGRPALVISDECRNLRRAMAGGYRYKRVMVAGADRYHDKPDKGALSHVAEALQYAMMGEGEQFTMMETPAMMGPEGFKPVRTQSRFN